MCQSSEFLGEPGWLLGSTLGAERSIPLVLQGPHFRTLTGEDISFFLGPAALEQHLSYWC